MTRRLIEKHGFNIVSLDADWPEAAPADRPIRHGPAGGYDAESIMTSITDLRSPTNHARRDALSEPRLERAIGVVCRPESELYNHCFDAVLPEQFDAFVWFERTDSVSPLSAGRSAGVPETYPFGA